MYIIQMADLHIGSATKTNPDEDSFLMQSVEEIKKRIPPGENILLSLCGDIIDSKDLEHTTSEEVKSRYQEAERLITLFMRKLKDDYSISVKCCMGNHDVTHRNEFYEFVQNLDDTTPSKAELESCYTVTPENCDIKIIFVNSCKGNQYKKGCIDYGKLEQELSSLERSDKKIIVLHHTIMSMFEEDDSSLRNAATFVNLIEKYNVMGVLHGHIHGREILILGENQCKVIGIGALFSRGNDNVNSQFNIIELQKNRFLKVLNYRYQMDGGNDNWEVKELRISSKENIFSGNSFQTVYTELMEQMAVTPLIENFRMEIKNKYDIFKKGLEEFLKDDFLEIGGKRYSYFQLAEMWQQEEVPKELYFNHGFYFKVNDKSGIEFIIEQLKNKPTSNRIVLTTYNMKDVHRSLGDKEYLPSLTGIQFGKQGEKIIVQMNLRALEANRFLKINICEIDYLLKKLEENSIDFKEVEIIISAFRVQKKEKFNCFLKAEIDSMESEKLTTKVNCKKISYLCKLLEEKRDAQETITKMQGIQIMYKAMKATNEESEEDGNGEVYSENLLDLLKESLEVYKKLDEIHRTSSIQTEQEKYYEKEIYDLLGNFIEELRKIER